MEAMGTRSVKVNLVKDSESASSSKDDDSNDESD
jgi:hypothetical protein